MPLTENDWEKIAQLACLDCDADSNPGLVAEVKTIMGFIEQLSTVDTKDIAPLFHPLDLYQRLRDDEVCAQDCSKELAKAAALFADGYYLVPKVIDTGL